jgi:hypothetical protein
MTVLPAQKSVASDDGLICIGLLVICLLVWGVAILIS